MTRCALFLFAAAMLAQEPMSKADLLSLTDQLQEAMQSGDWKKAKELSAALKGAVIAQRNRSLSGESNGQINRILKWLPPDTETLMVAQEPFTVPQPHSNPPSHMVAAASQYTLSPLDGALSDQALEGRTLKFAVLGARKFANHKPLKNDILPLGLIAYEGCGVYAFARPVEESALEPLQTSILGHPIREAKALDQNPDAADVETSFASLIKPDLLIACNSRDFLEQVLARIDGPSSTEAFPTSLSEWKQVDRSKPFWALRHFRAERAEQDPTYPGNGLIFDKKIPTPVGVVMDIDPSSGTMRARFISGSGMNPWKDIAEASDFQGLAKTWQMSPDVWELSLSAEKEVGTFAVFALMGVLGFAVLL